MVLQPDRAQGIGEAGTTAASGGGGGGSRAGEGNGGSGSTPSSAGTGGPTAEAGADAGAPVGQASSRAGTGGAAGEPPVAAGEPSADASVENPDANGGAAGDAATPVDAGDPVTDAGSMQPVTAQDPDCDFNGIWIAKQITISEALSLPQSSNNWYFLELRQTGSTVEVVRHFDCGIEIRGSLTVVVSRATLASLIPKNVQTGRRGTMTKQGRTCDFTMSRFWSIRGADEQLFLPADGRASVRTSDEVSADRPLPSANRPEGAVDTEGDGKPGVAFEVSGLGVRNSVQRDWTEWFTEPGFEITPSLDWTEELVVRADFDNEENVLDPPSGLLMSTSMPQTAAKHILKLRFLGRDASDLRAQEIIKDDEVNTCYAVQDAMPAEQLR